MTPSPAQIRFETVQKFDDATKHRLLVRMQKAFDIPAPVDLAPWQSQTQALRMRVAPIRDVVAVLDDVRNSNQSYLICPFTRKNHLCERLCKRTRRGASGLLR